MNPPPCHLESSKMIFEAIGMAPGAGVGRGWNTFRYLNLILLLSYSAVFILGASIYDRGGVVRSRCLEARICVSGAA